MDQTTKSFKGLSWITGTIFFYFAIGYILSRLLTIVIPSVLSILLKSGTVFNYDVMQTITTIIDEVLYFVIAVFSINLGVKNALKNTIIKEEDFFKISILEAGIVFSVLFIILFMTVMFLSLFTIQGLRLLGSLFILRVLPVGLITYYWLRKLVVSNFNIQENILQNKDNGIISSEKNENSINKAWEFVKTNYFIKGVICIFLSILFFSRYGGCNMPSTGIFTNLVLLLIFCLWLSSLIFFFTSIFKDRSMYKGLSIFGLVISFLSFGFTMLCGFS